MNTYGKLIDIHLDEANISELDSHVSDRGLEGLTRPTPACGEVNHQLFSKNPSIISSILYITRLQDQIDTYQLVRIFHPVEVKLPLS